MVKLTLIYFLNFKSKSQCELCKVHELLVSIDPDDKPVKVVTFQGDQSWRYLIVLKWYRFQMLLNGEKEGTLNVWQFFRWQIYKVPK